MIRLGSKVRDSITGFKGIATGRSEHLNGCVSVCIEQESVRKDSNNDPHRTEMWFDEQRVTLIEEAVFKPQGVYAGAVTGIEDARPRRASAGGPGMPTPPQPDGRE